MGWDEVTKLLGIGFGLLLQWIAGIPPVVIALLSLMLVDTAMGIGVAIKESTLSKDISWKGVNRKIAMLLVVIASAILQHLMADYVVFPLASITAGFYAAHETISIIKNAERLDVPIPDSLRNIVEQILESTNRARRNGKPPMGN